MTTTTISEARAHLPQLLTRVEDGDEVTITRHGKPVAVVVRPDTLRSRQKSPAWDNADRIGELLTQAWTTELPPNGGISTDRAEELIAEIREGRESR